MFMLKNGKGGASAGADGSSDDDSIFGRVKSGFNMIWNPKAKADKQRVSLIKNVCMFVSAAAAMHFYGAELKI